MAEGSPPGAAPGGGDPAASLGASGGHAGTVRRGETPRGGWGRALGLGMCLVLFWVVPAGGLPALVSPLQVCMGWGSPSLP